MESFGIEVTEYFKRLYEERKESIEYFCQYGDSMQQANASLIKEIALQA